MAYRTEMMAAVNQAYASDDVQALYDLADQLEPGQVVKLSRYLHPTPVNFNAN